MWEWLSLYFSREVGDFGVIGIIHDFIIREALQCTLVLDILDTGGVEGMSD
jgi:hypothetical protein